MTKRRSIIALFLVVALLAVGVGYAALTDTLRIDSSISAPAFDPKVCIEEYNLTMTNAGGADIVASVTIDDREGFHASEKGDTLTIMITGGFDYVGTDEEGNPLADTVVVTFKVRNSNDYKVTLGEITPVSGNSTDACFNTTVEWISTDLELEKDGVAEGKITFVLNSVPTADKSSAQFDYVITATAVTGSGS